MTSGGPTQVAISLMRAAGRPPIKHRGRAGPDNGAADVRHQNGHHGANVHIGQTGSGHSHAISAPTI